MAGCAVRRITLADDDIDKSSRPTGVRYRTNVSVYRLARPPLRLTARRENTPAGELLPVTGHKRACKRAKRGSCATKRRDLSPGWGVSEIFRDMGANARNEDIRAKCLSPVKHAKSGPHHGKRKRARRPTLRHLCITTHGDPSSAAMDSDDEVEITATRTREDRDAELLQQAVDAEEE